MKVALNGANGFVASYLKEKFTDYVVIQRDDSEQEILEKLQDVDAVFNLCGAPILRRWTEAYKKVLFQSRVQSTAVLVRAINQSKVKYFLSTSAIGAYPNDNAYDESFQGYNDDFLGLLTKEWENEANKCNKPTTILRFGVILGKNGGALAQMLTPFKFGLGGTIGDGKMMTSWIDIEDLVGIYEYVIENKLTGVINITAPNPISNATFTKVLSNELERPAFLPLPTFVLKLLFGDGASVLTSSKEVYPKRLIQSGYEFKYKEIESSLAHLLK